MLGTALPDDISSVLEKFEAALHALENELQPVLSLGVDEVIKELEPMEQAHLNIVLAESVNTLFTMFLKTHGSPLEGHPLQKELARMELYAAKVARQSGKARRRRPPRSGLDVVATNRFIEHAISDLTRDQRKKISEVSEQYKRHTAKSAGMADPEEDGNGAAEKQDPSGPENSMGVKEVTPRNTVPAQPLPGAFGLKDEVVAFLSDVVKDIAIEGSMVPGEDTVGAPGPSTRVGSDGGVVAAVEEGGRGEESGSDGEGDDGDEKSGGGGGVAMRSDSPGDAKKLKRRLAKKRKKEEKRRKSLGQSPL